MTISTLIEHYREEGIITIIGLTDGQLINVVNPKTRKTPIHLLARTFEKAGVPTLALNTGSTLFNKSEHAIAIVEEDLTAKEIQVLNSFAFISSAEKALRENGIKVSISPSLELLFRAPLGIGITPDTKLSSLLSRRPVVITSLLTNNLMRSIANNPLKILRDYERRATKPDYDYTIDKIKDPKTLDGLKGEIKRAYDAILPRTNGDTYGLGIFLPQGVSAVKEYDKFADYVRVCNRAYESICREYGVNYVNVEKAGGTTGKVNFQADPNFINECILKRMAEHIEAFYKDPYENSRKVIRPLENKPQGLLGLEHRERAMLEEAPSRAVEGESDPVTINVIAERERELKDAERATTKVMKIGKNNSRGI